MWEHMNCWRSRDSLGLAVCLAPCCSAVKGWYPQASSLPISELCLEVILHPALARDRNFTSKDFTVNDFLFVTWSLLYFYFHNPDGFYCFITTGVCY